VKLQYATAAAKKLAAYQRLIRRKARKNVKRDAIFRRNEKRKNPKKD